VSQLDYKIHGNDLQYVQVVLNPGQEMIAEQGAMMFIDQFIAVDAILGDGSKSKFGALGRFVNAFKRSLTGESMFSSIYTNKGRGIQGVAIAAPSPGEIVPIDLDEQGGTVICQKGAYLAGEKGQKIQLAFQKRVRVGLFGGEGFIMQKISGSGTVFIHASGTLKKVTLGPQDVLKIDTGCLVGMSSTIRYDIKYTGKLKTSLFGGEGLFYAAVAGPGTVWIQSLPMNRLSKVLMSAAISGRGKGSLAGKLYLLAIVAFVIFSLASGR
jgi:uncharacterized protein (TIGR00266 family)